MGASSGPAGARRRAEGDSAAAQEIGSVADARPPGAPLRDALLVTSRLPWYRFIHKRLFRK
jgi:hypothetical protein